MSKKLKIFLILAVITIILGFVGYKYIMTGGARDLSSEKTEFKVNSKEIISEFSTNIEVANKKYLDKAVAISGTITTLNDSIITIDNSIICSMKSEILSAKKDSKVVIKGRIIGYDDLIEELKLDQCLIEN